MYRLSDEQIDYILNDISARGVEMESLQQNLLDHVCCIIEQNLEENGNFEHFYSQTIKTFYKTELWEIEEETIQLLIFKNYYAMKKSMLVSGTISVSFFTMGLILKFLHMPGASMGIVLGIGILSFIFLPLVLVLKVKEKQATKDKLIIAFGIIAGVSISLGILFKVMRWPGANFLGLVSLATVLLAFLPVYFFTGIRKPETKVNTIVSSILIVVGCGLFLTLINSRPRLQENANMIANQFLQDSYENVSKQTNLVFKSFLLNQNENKEKFVHLDAYCNSVCDKIESLKLNLLNKTEDMAVKTIKYEGLGKLDTYDMPTEMLFSNIESAPPILMDLKSDLDSLDLTIHSRFNVSDAMYLLSTAETKNGSARNWEISHFYHVPLNFILRNLTQIQINIRCLEMSCLANEHAQALRTSK